MNGLKVLLYQMSQIRYTKCSKFVIPNVPNIRIIRYNIYRIYKYRSSKEQSFIGLPLLDRYFTKVSDLVSNGLNDRSNRMQSSMLELLR